MDKNKEIDDDPFNDFAQEEEKLNLTLDEKQEEEKEDSNPQIEKEFNDFMKSVGGTNNENFNMINECQKLFENMCIPQSGQPQQQGNIDGQQQQNNPFNFESLFSQMAGENNQNQNNNLQPSFDDFADKLLDQFLEKDVLYEPLHEAYINFEKLLNEKNYDINKEPQYLQQFNCIKSILNILENNPEKKTEMIDLFEKMQTFGDPPQEIIKLIGPDNPIGNYWNFNNSNAEQQNIGNNFNEECNIF